MISRFLKGCYRKNPSKPRYVETWDVSVVLEYLRSVNTQGSLENLTLKLVMLIALASAHRAQTIAAIELNNIHFRQEGAEILISQLIKTSNPRRTNPKLYLPYLLDNPDLCVASALQDYLERTKELRGSTKKLCISTKKIKGTYAAVTTQTISRWLKKVLEKSGIDVSKFFGHSTRHASTSNALARGANWDEIITTAGWSKNSNVFARFYNRPIVNKDNNFAKIVLDQE